LILAKDSFFEEPFILVNRKIVADLDIERYLKELLISKSGRNCLPLEEGIELEFDSDFLEIGSHVYLNDLPAMTGTYTSMDGVITVAIEEGRVTGMKYQKKYSTREGQITVSQRYVSRAAIGDMVMKLSRPAPDGVYNPIFSEQPEIHVKDGRILKVNQHIVKINRCACTHAYIIPKQTAIKLSQLKWNDQPIDHAWFDVIEQFYAPYPMTAFQTDHISSISSIQKQMKEI